jgi:type II secretory pathway predicted ATPase ExeA
LLLRLGIRNKDGFIVITGEVGVGKTILIYALLKNLSDKIKTAFIFHPRQDFKDLLKNILRDLGVPIEGMEDPISSLLVEFRKYLDERLTRDETVTIIIDEAHLLSKNSDTMYGRFIAALKAYKPYLKVIGLLEIHRDENLFRTCPCNAYEGEK